jgi:hypothetical protein
MCHLRAGRKLFLKNAGGEKIKNIGSAMSVGLLVVRFQYGLYVVVHLSKKCLLSCRFTLLPTEKALRWAAYEGQIYNTFLSFIRKFFP